MLRLLLPEVVLAAGLMLVLTAGFFRFTATVLFRMIALAAVVADLVLLIELRGEGSAVGWLLHYSDAGWDARMVMAIAALAAFPLTGSWQLPAFRSEFFAYMLSVLLGGQLMVVSDHLVMLLIGLELASIGSYALSGYLFTKNSAESGMKYFLFGGTATAFLAFGFSLVAFSAGGTTIASVAAVLGNNGGWHPLFMPGVVMITGALLFKLSAAPMHLWAPDVFQGAPMSAIGLFSTLPKVAAALVLMMLFSSGSADGAGNMLLAVAAVLTLFAGNFAALMQQDVRRLMAYSGIGQSGFLMLAVLATPKVTPGTLIYYAAVMSIATLLVLFCLQWFERRYDTQKLADFSGLGRDNRIAAVGLTAGMLSLTGIPPFAGFTGKLFIFTGLWSIPGFSSQPLLIGVFVFGLLNTAISLFYYLKLPWYLFLRPGTRKSHGKVTVSQAIWILVLTLSLLVLFLAPGLIL
ncbi:MAG: NADH-quinone oxidoreductase subunit N [Bacteroidota bacterium]